MQQDTRLSGHSNDQYATKSVFFCEKYAILIIKKGRGFVNAKNYWTIIPV